jgi:hypothetical protein
MRPLPLRFGLAGCGLVLALGFALWRSGGADGRLHIITPSLAGDGVLVVGPEGQTALIDGGTDGAAVASWLGEELPFSRRLDLLVLTRADRATLPGQVAAARRYEIGGAVLVRPVEPDPLWDELVRLLREQGVPVRYAAKGDQIRWRSQNADDAVTFEVLDVHQERLAIALATEAGRALMFQSVGDWTPTVAASSRVLALFYPGRRTTFDGVLQSLTPSVVVFGERIGDEAQRRFAERGFGAARLLHEATDGRIELIVEERRMSFRTQGSTER